MMNVINLDLTQKQLDEAIDQWKARQNAPLTNADRIRAMNDEELAECIFSDLSECACPPLREYGEGCAGYDSCISCWTDWLKEALVE